MEAIATLRQEHRVIERSLLALETAADHLQAGHDVDPSFFVLATDFIRGFADGRHHRKEEGVLFPAMQAAGIPSEGGPIAVMLAEHEQGRQYTGTLRAAAEKLAAGDDRSRPAVVQASRLYSTLLRQHIAKEEDILFPMAENVLDEPAQARVAKDFEEIDRDETGEAAHARFLSLVETLERMASG